MPLTLSANLALQGAASYRLSRQIVFNGDSQRELSVVGVWRIDERSSWRLSASNLLGQTQRDTARYRDGASGLTTLTATPTWATFRLAFESKL